MAKGIAKEIRRATRRRFNTEEKIRIVLEGLSIRVNCLHGPSHRF
jgi:transposase-like protein